MPLVFGRMDWGSRCGPDFLMDSGSAKPLWGPEPRWANYVPRPEDCGVPMVLKLTSWGAHSVWSRFLGLRAEFPILVCDLSTDAIIGTDIFGSILPHTLNMDCCLQKAGCPFNYTAGMLRYQDVCSPWDIARFHHTRRQLFTVPLVLWVAGRCRPVDCWKA